MRSLCSRFPLETRVASTRNGFRATLLASLLCLISPTPGQAGLIHYGLRAGANLASIRGDFADLVDPKIQPGLAAGGFARLSLVPMFGIEMDVLYVQKGFKVESQGTDENGNPAGIVKAHLRLQYLDVPVVARLSLPSWGLVSPYVVAGPNVAFGLGAKQEAFGEEVDLGSDLKKVVLGATGGVGLKLGAGPVGFGIESRYQTDFSDLWDLENNVESINQGVSITAWVSK